MAAGNFEVATSFEVKILKTRIHPKSQTQTQIIVMNSSVEIMD